MIAQKPVVLITGNSGLIGAPVARDLADDFTVVGLDVKEPGADWAGDRWFHCDLTSDQSMERALTAILRKRSGD
jgi:nucleoside-diphosphate-sugar epimerase